MIRTVGDAPAAAGAAAGDAGSTADGPGVDMPRLVGWAMEGLQEGGVESAGRVAGVTSVAGVAGFAGVVHSC